MLYRCNAVNKRNWSRSTGRSRRVTLDAVVVQLAAAGKLARSPSYTRHKHATENVQPSSSECDAILSYTAVQLRFTTSYGNLRTPDLVLFHFSWNNAILERVLSDRVLRLMVFVFRS